MFFLFKQVRILPEKDWCSHQFPYGSILPQVAAFFVNFYVSTDMIAWWVSVQCHTQNFYLRCFKLDFDAIKRKFGVQKKLGPSRILMLQKTNLVYSLSR